jgi:hypothetical protein
MVGLSPVTGRCDAPSTTTVIDFETLPADGLIAGPGKNSTAKASVAGDAVHAGLKAGKVAYTFSGSGYIEFQLVHPIQFSDSSNPVDITLWVKGAGHADFANVALRLFDSKGNVYQYAAPGLADKFNGDGWARFQITLDPTKFLGTWGPSPDKTLKPPVMFFGFGADHAAAAPTASTVYVDDVRISPAGSKAATVVPSITLTADRDIQIVKPGEAVTFKAGFVGVSTDDPLTYRWRVHDFDGKIVAESPKAVTHGGLPPDPYTVRPAQPGFYFVTLDLLDADGGVVSETRSSLAALVKPGVGATVAGAPLIGVCSHLGRFSQAQVSKQIELMRQIGFNIIRDGDNWGGVQPQEGVWNWDKVDHTVAELKKAKIDMLFVLAYTAKWATTGNQNSKDWHDWNNAPPITEKYVAYAKAAVNRYKLYVHYWEIWNEPDLTFWLGTADQYATLLSASVKGIHEADPSAKVMNGGVSEVNFRPGFPADFLAKTDPKPDIFAYHTHGNVANLAPARAKVDGWMAKGGIAKTPVWLNEAGIAAVGGISVREQAIVLAKKIMVSQGVGDQCYILYDMVDDGTSPADPEHNMGVVFNNMTPKPATVGVHTVIDCIGGKAFAAKLAAETEQTIYCYRGLGQTVVALWTDRPGIKASTLVKCSAPQATLTDLMGRTTILKPANGYYTLPLAYEPAFFSVAGEKTEIAPVKPIMTAPSATIAEGTPLAYEITVANPLKTRLTGSLGVESDTLKVEPAISKVDIPAGKSQAVRVRVTVSPGTPPSQLLRLRLSPTDGLPVIDQEVRLRTAVTVRTLSAGANPEDGMPLATLDPRRNLVSLFEATPMEALKFHGGADLSAKVWVNQVPEGLRIHAVVTDDVHNQLEQPGAYWKGDSLQIALVGPSEQLLEWTAALTAAGPRIERSPWPLDLASIPVSEQVQATRVGTTTTYDVMLSRANPEIAKALQFGCRLSLLINDNDGGGRKGWLEWTPGIGKGKDSSYYVPISFGK